MSPDTIFAAQMWSWPDAVIKRNAQGQVLLVNAAFLAMYGGTVEDWSGNMVSGWSNPPAPGTAIRFETRLPAPMQTNAIPSSEQVFDWIESAAPDGTSLAIARNISHVQPQPGMSEPQTEQTVASEIAPPLDHAPTVAESVFEPVMRDVASEATMAAPATVPAATANTDEGVQQSAHMEAAHVKTGHTQDAPVAAPAPALAPAPAVQTPQATADAPASDESVMASIADDALLHEPSAPLAPIFETHPQDTLTANPDVKEASTPEVQPDEPAAVSETQTNEAETPQDAVATGDREFERRALPIEDGSAVLGNNWRDAVIAKAVGATGAEAPVMETTEEATPHSAPALTNDSGTIRILLAEDNAINALLTRTLLEAEGCVVDTVEDGALAVEAMKVKTYDLIFMDMRMPNMDGLESTRKIRQMDHRSKGLPIIALTANAFDDDRNACFDAGMNDFMTKPVSAEELSEMVAAWTGEAAKEKLARMA